MDKNDYIRHCLGEIHNSLEIVIETIDTLSDEEEYEKMKIIVLALHCIQNKTIELDNYAKK